MKKSAFKASAIFIAAMGAFGSANAQIAKIDITGEITPNTCVLTSSDRNGKRVALGNVKPTDFANVGSTQGQQPFTLTLEGCSTGTGQPTRASVRFSGSNINANTSNLNLIGVGSPGVAGGVQVRILNDDDTRVLLASANQGVTQYAVVTGGAPTILRFKADYTAISLPVTSGRANTAVDFEITYP